MKKVLNIITAIFLTVLFVSGGSTIIEAKSKHADNNKLLQIASNLPDEEKSWLEHAIEAGKEGETAEYLATDEGQKLTEYLKTRPELVAEIITSTKAYQAATKTSNSPKFSKSDYIQKMGMFKFLMTDLTSLPQSQNPIISTQPMTNTKARFVRIQIGFHTVG